ncbi:MAG: 2,5-diamino-6-(ribosylamino)-4(3H)-pyrimidinone 5'-phosphate reductase [Nitrososphaerales archaeon]
MARYRPHVIMNAAMTLDGKITTVARDSKISSTKDLLRVHRLRSKVDAVMVGINTVLADDPMLTARRVKGRNPTRIIVDSKARIGLDSRIMHSCNKILTIIATSQKASRAKLEKIIARGAIVIILGKNKVDLAKLLSILKDSGMNRLLVEGGGEINWAMLASGFVDEVMVTVAPRIVGGRNAVTLVEGPGFAKISKGIKLKLHRAAKNGNEIVLFYKVV